MASIERRTNTTGSTTYRVIWYMDGIKQPPMTYQTEEDALRWKRAVETTKGDADKAALMLERANTETPTLVSASDHYLERLRGAPYTKQTYQSYMRNHIGPALGGLPCDTITDDDVRNLIGRMEDKSLSVKMIRNVCGYLTGVLDHAVERGWATSNPYNHKMLPEAEPREERDMFLTLSEAEAIIDRARPGHRDPMRLMLATGLRPGELRALLVEDVNLTARQPSVRVTKAMKQNRESGDYVGTPKSKKSVRSVGLPPSAVDTLRPYVEGRSPIDSLFLGSTGKRIDGSTLRASWRAAVAQARKDGKLTKTPSLYSLRHTHASLMLDAGMSIFQLSRHMGHGSVTVTEDVYAHLMPDAQYQAASFAAKALGGQGQIDR
ncbi:tyrosine-type recombinase/integrase [Nesterenkonia suensis]